MKLINWIGSVVLLLASWAAALEECRNGLRVDKRVDVPVLDHRYEQQRLLTCTLKSQEELQQLHGLRAEGFVDLWTESVDALPAQGTFRCHERAVPAILRMLHCTVQPLEPILQRWQQANQLVEKSLAQDFFDNYRSYDDIQKWLHALLKHKAADGGKLLLQVDSMGKSVEGRDLTVVKVTRPGNGGFDGKRVMWVSGGQHAREWIAPAAVLYLLDTAVAQRDPDLDRLLDTHVLVVAPQLNPDGYEYSRLTDRLWRKNRVHNGDGSYGVDLNRNWAAQWGVIGTTSDPSSDIFCGPRLLSEPETSLTAAYIQGLANSKKIAGLDVHSYGQKVLRNYGYTMVDSRDEARIRPVGEAMAHRASKVHATKYVSEKSAALYPTGGGMDDWFYAFGGMHGFTIELRDDGRTGFLLPAKYIRPTGDELIEIVKAVMLGLMS